MRFAAAAALLLTLASCKPAEDTRTVAIVGAVLIDGAGGPPLTDSLVLTAGGLVRAAGRRTELSIPADANVIDGSGKYLVPALIDITADKSSLPTVSTLAEARSVVGAGASAFVGIMRDTTDIDPAFISQLRDLKVVVAPALISARAALPTAEKNAQRLFAAGVPIAVAANGNPLREAELLVGAGIPPLDVIVAGTRNSALALRQLDQRGTIQPGKRADLLLLDANPGEDIRNLGRVARRMNAGEWR